MSLSSLHLAEWEEKVVRFVLEKAQRECKPTRKIEIDKLVSDESRPLIDELLKMELLREENAEFYPTLRAMLAEPETYGEVIRSLDSVISFGRSSFAKDQPTIKVQEMISAIFGEHDVVAHPPGRFLFECALFGLPPAFIGVQSLTSTRAPDEIYIRPAVQRVNTLADMLTVHSVKALEGEETLALHELFKAYLKYGDRRRGIIGFRTDGQLRALRGLLDAGKVERYGTGGFFLSHAGLEDAKERFGTEDDEEDPGEPRAKRAAMDPGEPRAKGAAMDPGARRAKKVAVDAGARSGKGVTMDPRKVFVIHGRDLRARDAMFDFLRALNLEAIEWSKATRMTGSAAPYTGEILDAAFAQAHAVVALFTGDDEAHLRARFLDPTEEPEPLTPQPRPNVLFEAGRAFGSHPNRVVLVEVGRLRGLSDLTGRHAVRIPAVKQWRLEIANRLHTAGCDVDMTGHDWLEKGSALEDQAMTPEVVQPVPEKPPSTPPRPEIELRHLFRLAIVRRVDAAGTEVVDLRKERQRGEEWSTLPEEMLADELHRMRDMQLISVASEVGAVFELVSVPSTVSEVSEFERARE
jgi:predicted nucleotide-binding protein